MTDEWLDQDAIGSYHDAIKAIGERVKNGEPLPDLFGDSSVRNQPTRNAKRSGCGD